MNDLLLSFFNVCELNVTVGKSLATETAGVLEETSLEPGSRLSYLNQVKMLCYLLCQFMDMFEDDVKEKCDVITTGKVKLREL